MTTSTAISPTSTGESVHDRVLAELHAGLDEAHALGLVSLDVVELERFTCETLRIAERARALAAAAVAEADHARLAHAWAGGTLTEAHIRELKALDGPRTRTVLLRDQHVHIDNAQTLCFTDWQQTLAYWLLHADPDGTLTPQRAATYGIKTRVQPNGDVEFHGRLDPLTGEAFLTIIEHETEKLFRTEQTAGHNNGALTNRARKSIALMRLLKQGFQRTDGSFPLPLINIVMSEKVAEDLLARTTGTDQYDPHTLPLHWGDIDARCETIRGTPIDPRRTLPALLIGRLRRQILDAKSRTTDLGHDTRLFPTALKNALLVESRGSCTTPGCDAPYTWLTADHITPHTHHGPTALTNGQTLCNPDNHRKSDHYDVDDHEEHQP
jgi:5-methylcytosine-specific restriction endonuclease McrA